ncbi:hypothetical protein DCO58_06815 [Helicobacter saguini]|uniref:Uncharacterized protein n=1 Tax=Helicobacter saguini TaxID=1548018 RepID=A0A347VN02_9HELI|nr:aminotransferase class IV [Helicobacter saguini]MWV61955.1 hypothetical protein [Helicobacter saguini]MWV67370.1 hypothetical protein [Helicobacter saguini]MWV69723.1 hypothetical protein [Helicobacter saguini]MWV73060.1 hypothetical protein [Helicobacter saguini]TLD95566.1 hypothetical protein LS64_001535 [Helicobacter saguini]
MQYDIFETMLVSNNKIFILNHHLHRMLKSAEILNFNTFNLLSKFKIFFDSSFSYFVNKNIKLTSLTLDKFKKIDNLWFNFQDFSKMLGLESMELDNKNYILKLILKCDGNLIYEVLQLNKFANSNIIISKNIINSNNIFLYHKTTNRNIFKDSVGDIQLNKCFDYIYFNEKHELTQGSRSNIIIKFNGSYLTPNVKSGLLRGTLSKLLLDSKICKETIIYMEDLLNAEKIFCVNSVRGILQVNLQE